VVDEAVGHLRLVGHVGDPAAVEALAGEDADGGVEDDAALVHAVGVAGGGHYARTSSGQR
jgi:hypothetical protein